MHRIALPAVLLIGATSQINAASLAAEIPDYFPQCATPQRIGPLMPIGITPSISGGAALAWNGDDFGTLINDGGPIKFQRLAADGSPLTSLVTIANSNTGGSYPTPQLIWTGSGYGAAWLGYDSGSAKMQAYFARLNAQGGLLSGPTRVSSYGVTPAGNISEPLLALDSTYGNFAVVWQDDRNYATTLNDVYYTVLNASGAVTASDVAVAVTAANEGSPALMSAFGYFHVYWTDFTNNMIRRTSYFNATPIGAPATVIVSTNTPRYPFASATGSAAVLVWSATDGEIRFSRLNSQGNLLGATTIVSSDAPYSQNARVAWSGAEYGVLWMNNDTSNGHELMFRRVADDGTPLGTPLRLYKNDASNYLYPSLAFGQRGYGVTINPGFMALGCNTDATAPSCPGNFNAYNITGTTASVTWSPASDAETDLAYYAVYRNNALVAKTSAEYYNDSGLSLSGTYNYMIQPVNAAQMQNTACTGSIYVRTNSTLTLTMNKAGANDAGLEWTDAGFNNYNLFRGTSPQVMTQIGSTPDLSSTDPNVLPSPVSYFYSVDNPGP